MLFYVICVFCLLVVLVRLSVPVQVSDRLERLVSEVTYNVLMGTLNPTHSFTHSHSLTHSLTHGSTVYSTVHHSSRKSVSKQIANIQFSVKCRQHFKSIEREIICPGSIRPRFSSFSLLNNKGPTDFWFMCGPVPLWT